MVHAPKLLCEIMKLYEKTHIFSHTEDSIGLNALQPNTNEVNVILFVLLRALKDTLKFPNVSFQKQCPCYSG